MYVLLQLGPLIALLGEKVMPADKADKDNRTVSFPKDRTNGLRNAEAQGGMSTLDVRVVQLLLPCSMQRRPRTYCIYKAHVTCPRHATRFVSLPDQCFINALAAAPTTYMQVIFA